MEQLLAILKEIRPDVDFEAEELGDAFGITLSPADIVPANFHSAQALWEMIERKQR